MGQARCWRRRWPALPRARCSVSAQARRQPLYAGPVNDMFNSEQAVQALGSADVALLANHGVLVIGKDVRDAYMRSMILEWRCRQAWHMEALGGGVPMRDEVVRSFGALIDSVPDAFDGFFEAMSRRVLREDPSVLD